MRTVHLIRAITPLLGTLTLTLVDVASAVGAPPIALSWSAPQRADCPDAAYVLGEIERYVGGGSARSGEPIRATATVRGVGHGGWQLLLRTTDGGVSGERAFQDDSCRAVADAAVVVLAWMIDPDAMANRTAPAAKKSAPPPPPPPPPPPSRASVVASDPHRISPFVALGFIGDRGTLPWLALGAELRAGVVWRRFRLAASAAYWPNRSKVASTSADGVSAGARFSLATSSLEGCFDLIPRSPARPVELSLCAGPEVDWVHGAGFGVSEPAQGSKAWFALDGGVDARLRIRGPLRLVIGARAIVPTEREHFALHDVGEIYRPAIVAGRAGLGLELAL